MKSENEPTDYLCRVQFQRGGPSWIRIELSAARQVLKFESRVRRESFPDPIFGKMQPFSGRQKRPTKCPTFRPTRNDAAYNIFDIFTFFVHS